VRFVNERSKSRKARLLVLTTIAKSMNRFAAYSVPRAGREAQGSQDDQ
jgi:hypothetical protein